MAYRMKGSPTKLGTIQGTSGYKSALKQKTYKEAYKTADKTKYKTEEDFVKAVKKWNMDTYGTENPTRDARELGIDFSTPEGKKKMATRHKDSQKKLTVTKLPVKTIKPKVVVTGIIESVEPELNTYPTRMAEIKKAAPDRAKYGVFTKEGREVIKKRRQAVKAKRDRIKDKKILKDKFEKDLKKQLRSGDITKEEYRDKKKTSRKIHKDYLKSEDLVKTRRAQRKSNVDSIFR